MILHPNRECGPIHSQQCKERLIEELKKTLAGSARVQQAERRQTKYIVRHLDKCDARDDGAARVERDERGDHGNEREDKLDHSEAEWGELKHDDAVQGNDMDVEEQYDMFMGPCG